jgi:hypothetical protein
MNNQQNEAFKISLRLKNGWSKPVDNFNRQLCDIDGARLWMGPGGQIYCDLIHDPDVIPAQPH